MQQGLLRRFALYGIGFGLGSILVYFTFLRNPSGDYDNWTWRERVKESIREDSTWRERPLVACLLQCREVESAWLDSLLVHAEVEIDGPAGDRDTLLYHLDLTGVSDQPNLQADFLWIRSQEAARLVALQREEQANPCPCP